MKYTVPSHIIRPSDVYFCKVDRLLRALSSSSIIAFRPPTRGEKFIDPQGNQDTCARDDWNPNEPRFIVIEHMPSLLPEWE